MKQRIHPPKTPITVTNDSYPSLLFLLVFASGQDIARLSWRKPSWNSRQSSLDAASKVVRRERLKPPRIDRMYYLRKTELLLLVVGLLLLGIYMGARVHKALLSRAALERFKVEQSHSPSPPLSVELQAVKPDFSLWSEKRIKDYRESLTAYFAPAIGILRIPKIRVEVPVLEGTDDLTLNRGVGRIAGTAGVGQDGNIGIAGHRDGFFRGLKDIGLGDVIELVTTRQVEKYVVDRVVIVDPNDVSPLQPRSRPSLTLVTCYPFYFVGSAPKRYIVEASIADYVPDKNHAPDRSNAYARNSDEPQGTR